MSFCRGMALEPGWAQHHVRVWRLHRSFLTICVRTHTGAEHIYDLGEMNDYEKEGLKEAIAALKGSIDKGIEFANNKV